MTPAEALEAFMECVMFESGHGTDVVTVSCNFCYGRRGTVTLFEGTHPDGSDWFAAFLEHAMQVHPERLAGMTGGAA